MESWRAFRQELSHAGEAKVVLGSVLCSPCVLYMLSWEELARPSELTGVRPQQMSANHSTTQDSRDPGVNTTFTVT